MVNLSEDTRIDLKFNNVWAILISVVVFVGTAVLFYSSIDKKMEMMSRDISEMRSDLAGINSSFEKLHDDVVENHDDIIVLKQKIGVE